jgi:hypothetical protein
LNSSFWLAVGSSFIGAAAAFFVQQIVTWWRRPDLRVEVENDSGFVVARRMHSPNAAPGEKSWVGVWLRVRVVNAGRGVARESRVFLTRFESATDSKIFRESTDPAALNWAHLPPGSAIDIPPGMGFFADVILLRQTPAGVRAMLQSETDLPLLSDLLTVGHELSAEFTPTHASGLGRSRRARVRPGPKVDDYEWRSWP